MVRTSREFQVFVKPVGAICNLDCQYCYYLRKEHLYRKGKSFRMPEDLLEQYIIQHIDASTEPVISFSWHGGEPTMAGLETFHKIVTLQRKHNPSGRQIVNGIQTNGTLLNKEWCNFLASEKFVVGISLDGPEEFHNRFRMTKDKKPTFGQTMRGHELLQRYNVSFEILCVVNAFNVQQALNLYRFFKQLDARYITFLPLVEPQPDAINGVSSRSVPPQAFGDFLSTIFDEWVEKDIGQVKVQIFEEAARTAFGQEHTLCIFKRVCGGVPVVEHNGDFYSCDHFVDAEHYLGNIRNIPLKEMLDCPEQKAFGQVKWETLPQYCLECEVREMCNGECPKNRFIRTPDGETGLNYLCSGYRKFFNHCRPFVEEVAEQWQKQVSEQQVTDNQQPASPSGSRAGRNDPCPCGSGRKYKNCCLRDK